MDQFEERTAVFFMPVEPPQGCQLPALVAISIFEVSRNGNDPHH